MSVFFQKDIDKETKLGIWQIEEEEAFFLQKVAPQRNVSNEHKRMQHLAGRYLLTWLFDDFPAALIQIADTRKPFLENEAYHFSISHCGLYAAALVSKTKRVGVDIEMVTPKIQKIKNKFLSEEEQKMIIGQWPVTISASNPLTLLWSCKEAVFKWYGLGSVDFKEHIVVKEIKQIAEHTYETTICFQKNKRQLLLLKSELMMTSNDISQPRVLVCSTVVT